jgi:hypothetical protein
MKPEHYNNVRLNSAIGYTTPKDMLAGYRQEIQAERDRKLEAAREQRKNRRQRAAGKKPVTTERSPRKEACSFARSRERADSGTPLPLCCNYLRRVRREVVFYQHGGIGGKLAAEWLRAPDSCAVGISTMRKSLWLIPGVLLLTALGSTPAHADGVVVLNGGGDVTAIDSITLNGSLYNVTFTSTIDNTFNAYAYNDPTLLAIVTAIDASLMRKSLNDPTGTAYGVATAGSRALVAVGGRGISGRISRRP